jgi:hypothetical protein
MRILIIDQAQVVESFQVEELMLAREQFKLIDSGYQELKLPTPEWIMDKLGEINREITLRVRADLERQLKNAKARRAALATADEKRQLLDAQITALEETLKK